MWKSLCVALVVALAAAGCGAEGVDPRTAVAEAASKTTGAGSSRMSLTGTVTVDGKTLTMTAEGLVDYAGRIGRLVYSFEGGDEFDPADELPDEIVAVFDGTRYYMSLGTAFEVANGPGPRKRWIMYDAARLGDEVGADIEALPQLEENPMRYVEFLYGATEDVEVLGEEQVRGVTTTRYRASVDLRRITERSLDEAGVPEDSRDALRRELDGIIRETGLSTIPIEVWVDADGLLRRYVMTIEVRDETGTLSAVKAVTRMELYDFGVEVDVDPPRRGTYVDVTDRLLQEQTD